LKMIKMITQKHMALYIRSFCGLKFQKTDKSSPLKPNKSAAVSNFLTILPFDSC